MMLKTRLFLGVVLVIVTLSVSGMAQYYLQKQSQNEMSEILNSSIIELNALQEIHFRIPQVSFLTNEIHEKLETKVVSNEELFDERRSLNESVIKIQNSMDLYSHTLTFHPDEEQQLITSIEEDMEYFLAYSNDILKSDQNMDDTFLKFFALENHMMANVEKAIAFEMTEIQNKQESFDASALFLSQIRVVAITVSSVIFIIVGLSINTSVSRSLYKIKNWIQEISMDNFNAKIEISKHDDFFKIIESINTLSNELERYKNELLKNERFATIGEMSSRLTHDIKNPLSVILASVEIIEDREKNSDNQILKKYLPMIRRSVENLNVRIDDVLGFVGTSPLNLSLISLNDILERSLQNISIPKYVKVSLPEIDTSITCDPHKLQIVFENILINSIHAIGNTSGKINITIKENNSEIIIDIEDSGSGIPEDVMGHIFEPLYTTKSSGTGLGLVSCKKIIEQHGGKISVRNSTSGGAIFSIVLPKSPKTS